MDKNVFRLDDVKRILFGEAPPEFLIEVFFRTFVIYVAVLFTVRWLGKRMSGQLTINEMTILLTLGAIASVPMQEPDRGLLQGLTLLFITLVFQRGLGWIEFKSAAFERLSQGSTSLLIKDGVLQLEQMKKSRITRQQIFAELRQGGTFNLGMVDRLYLEAGGIFSLYKATEKRPGLTIAPPDDRDIFNEKQPLIELMACVNCGYVTKTEKNHQCEDCGQHEWIEAS